MKRLSTALRHVTLRTTAAFVAFAIVLGAAQAAVACPNCKDAMVNDTSQQGDLVHGYFYSILFMMSMPFALVGTFSFCMYRAVRKARTTGETRRADATEWDVTDSKRWPSDSPPRDLGGL